MNRLSMKLYNTLTRTIEEITPQQAPEVTIYTCGPTVYDYPHVGNWFTFIRYDLLVRSLKLQGLKPKWVMNITDVGHLTSDADEGEDKLEKGARREGKSAWDVAKFYGDYFVNGLERLAITTPNYLPKATEHIAEQIALIQTLQEKGFTYTIDDGVYFDTSKFEGYAAFARLDLDDLQAGARVEYNTQKKNLSDFALWKFSPAGQKRDMEWDSPFTSGSESRKGFPGWHLECSAMSMKYLGDTIDIHAGGIDHVPVHHTNEIAQSEAATGKRFAIAWMHANHISVEGDKISKSLGNGITLEDIEAKGFSLQAFRLHVLESHYRTQSKFSWESMEAAANRLQGFLQTADLRWQTLPDNPNGVTAAELANSSKDISIALANDLKTPSVLTAMNAQFAQLETRGLAANAVDAFADYLQGINDAIGINLIRDDISQAQKTLLASRDKARQDKDWTQSDKLRDELKSQGIALHDTSSGAVWYYI